MHRNFVHPDLFVSQTYSSELAVAPVTNLYDRVRRTKVWRTAGYFEVTTSNRAIVLQEVAGVNQTVNIATGTYATDALFLAAVKAALDGAAGSATYTVSRDTTSKKIVITSNGGGGAIFRLMVTNGSFTADNLLGFDDTTDKTGALTYTADNIRIHTSEWIRWDLGTATNIQAFAIIGPRASGLGISSQAVVTLQGNTTDTWTAPQYTEQLTYNEFCMAKLNADGIESGGLRYWRLQIVDYTNPLGYVEIASAFLGELLEPEEGCVNFPLRFKYIDFSRVDQSEWGNKSADVKQETMEVSLEWQYVDKASKEEMEEMVGIYKTAYPFWVALDPNEAFSTDFQNMIFQVQFQEMPDFILRKPNQFESTWDLRECV